MKKRKLHILFMAIVSVAVGFCISTTAGNKIIIILKEHKISNTVKKISQAKQTDTAKIEFNIPPVKCGNIAWKDTIIANWLANYCSDKCNDTISSGYKFSGQIRNPNKNSSLKVTIKTDKEYAQPVRFDPESGKFIGKVYFDKVNRMDTPIKIMLRDSNNTVIRVFTITLTE
jgi:hypothetical protein